MNKKHKIGFTIILRPPVIRRLRRKNNAQSQLEEDSAGIMKTRKAMSARRRHQPFRAGRKGTDITRYVKFISLPLLLLITISSSAQKILSLEEAIANTLQKNYDIILSGNDSAIAAIDYSYRGAAFIPRLNANVGTNWNNNNQKQTLSDGTKRDKKGLKSNNITGQLALNWTLFDGLKMFITRDRLEQLVEFGELEIGNQVVTTVANVINNYYNIVRQ